MRHEWPGRKSVLCPLCIDLVVAAKAVLVSYQGKVDRRIWSSEARSGCQCIHNNNSGDIPLHLQHLESTLLVSTNHYTYPSS